MSQEEDDQRQQLVEEKLVQICALELFQPDMQDDVLDALLQHYQTFTQDGNLSWAEKDVQSAGNILYFALQGQHIEAVLAEHSSLFGAESAQDVQALSVRLLSLLLEALATTGEAAQDAAPPAV